MQVAIKTMKVGGMKVAAKLKKKSVLIGDKNGVRRLNDAWETVIKEPVKANAKAKQGKSAMRP